ncbi:hypothetical protein EFR92_06660 [Lentilactobacillus buchneri]|nr:hypothetical protein [Lentilactobacillus buchneri]
MSREIKFRAWDKNENRYFIDGKDGYFANLLCCDDWDMDDPSGYVWEQFTGLKDGNGDDIYENDLVLLDPDDPPYQVIFDEGKFELSNDYLRLVYDLSEEHMDCEIIGNVHTNPELLEAQHD